MNTENFNWNDIQLYYNEGNSYREVNKKFGTTNNLLGKAKTEGLFIPRTRSESVKVGRKRFPVIISDEQKSKISKSMKKTHSEGKHPGWSINGDKDRRSYPEKSLIKYMDKYGLFEKYTIVEKMPFGKYWFDFALIDYKINIEIDGQQHFRTEEAIEHDKRRDGFSKSKGWRVFRIAWLNFQNKADDIMKELIEFINSNKTERTYKIEEVKLKVVKNKQSKKYESQQEYIKYRKQKALNDNKEKINIVVSSDIDFSKSGWSGKIATLINIKPQKVSKWMRKYCPETWETCWKRKGTK